MFLTLILACNPEPDPEPGAKPRHADPAEPADTAEPEAEPEPQGEWASAGHLTGTLLFNVSPAGEEGPAPCAYRRNFDGIEMLGLTDYACPDCRVVFEGEVTVPEEDRTCFDSWFPHWTGTIANRHEYWGWSRSDFNRSAYPNPAGIGSTDFVMPEEGGETVFTYETASGGAVDAVLSVVGTLRLADSVRVPALEAAPRESYLCGWPTGNDGTIQQPRAIALGGVVPELPMEDGCGEPLALRDLTGEWVLFIVAKADCPSCVYTALGMQEWASTAAQPVRLVTLFEGDDAEFEQAQVDYGAFGPVLRNRGYAQIMAWSLAYTLEPASAWWLVDPSQTVLAAGTGLYNDFSALDEVM